MFADSVPMAFPAALLGRARILPGLACWLAVSLTLAAAPTESQRERLAKAERHERKGWIYLRVEGAPRDRGFQHGYLLAKEIVECLRVRRAMWEYQSGMGWTWLVERSTALITPRVDAENLAELDGIAEGLAAAGTPVPRDELVAFNAFFELSWYWWPKEKEKILEYD